MSTSRIPPIGGGEANNREFGDIQRDDFQDIVLETYGVGAEADLEIIQQEIRVGSRLIDRLETDVDLKEAVFDFMFHVGEYLHDEYPDARVEMNVENDLEDPSFERYMARVWVDVMNVEDWTEVKEQVRSIARNVEKGDVMIYTYVDRMR